MDRLVPRPDRALSLTPPPVVLTLAAALAMSACAADPAASESPSPSQAAPPSAAASMAEPSEAPESMAPASEAPSADAVLLADSDLGEILTDADGLTIYYFANDTEGVSNCEGDCLANWPAVEVEPDPTGGDGVEATLGTIERSDGTTQLTVNGFPAYLFAADAEPGDTNGQGAGGVWWVFDADGEPIEE